MLHVKLAISYETGVEDSFAISLLKVESYDRSPHREWTKGFVFTTKAVCDHYSAALVNVYSKLAGRGFPSSIVTKFGSKQGFLITKLNTASLFIVIADYTFPRMIIL